MKEFIKKFSLSTFLIGIILFLTLPFISIILWSIGKDWSWPNLLPAEWSGQAWQYLIANHGNMLEATFSSFWLAAVVTVLVTIISIPAAKTLALDQFRGKKLIEILIFLPIIVPPIAVVMGVHHIFIKAGIADTFFGVVMAHLIPTTPYMVRVLKTVYAVVGDKMEEQSKALGANGWQTFRYITFPMIVPGIITGGVLVFLISLSQYLLTFLIGGGRILTLPLLLLPYVNSGNRPLAAVLSLIFTVPGIFIILATEFYLKKRYKDIDLYFV